MGYAAGSPARVSWRSRWSGKGTRASMDLPPSSSEREQVVPVASGMPASAAPSSGMHRLVKVAWRSRWVSANSGMPVVSVSTRAAPEVDAAFRAETSHSRAMRPSTRGPLRPVGSLWAWTAQGMISRPAARAAGRLSRPASRPERAKVGALRRTQAPVRPVTEGNSSSGIGICPGCRRLRWASQSPATEGPRSRRRRSPEASSFARACCCACPYVPLSPRRRPQHKKGAGVQGLVPGPDLPAGPYLQGPPHSAMSFGTFFTFQAHRQASGWKPRSTQLVRLLYHVR